MANDIRQSTIGTLNLKIIPFIVICYFVANLDKTNISIAALQMNADLGLTTSMYGFGVGVFYISYILFEVPSNVIMTHVGARVWIARILITWGIVSSLMAFVQSPTQLYIMRFLLGWAEAGFAPGIIYYLSCWFPKSNRARAMSFFYMGSVTASMIGMPLSGAILGMSGIGGLMGWRWLFLIEGFPAVVLGIMALRCLPDRPANAKWLPDDQKKWLQQQLAREQAAEHGHQRPRLRTAFTSPLVGVLSLIWFLQAFGTIGLTLFMPMIISSMHVANSNFAIGALSGAPFAIACVAMYWNGRHSDRHQERAWHMGAPLLLAGLCMGAVLVSSNAIVAYLCLSLAVGLVFALTPVFWATTTERLSGITSAAAIALINTLANGVGLGLPPLLGQIKDATQSYDYGLMVVAGALLLGGVICVAMFGPHRRHPETRARKYPQPLKSPAN